MKYLTFADLREKLGARARSTIYLDVEAGRLPTPIKLGGRLYWRDDEVDDWLRPATVDVETREEDRAPAPGAGEQCDQDRRRMRAADKQGPAPDIGRRRIGERPTLAANPGSRCAHRVPSGEEGTQ